VAHQLIVCTIEIKSAPEYGNMAPSRPVPVQASTDIHIVEEVLPDLLDRPRLVGVAWRIIRVLKRMFAVADDVEKAFSILLVGVVFRVMLPNLFLGQSSRALGVAEVAYPARKPCPDQLWIFRDGTPVCEVMLLSVDERHFLSAGDALVAEPVMDFGSNSDVVTASHV
jgi:hypothetical protein